MHEVVQGAPRNVLLDEKQRQAPFGEPTRIVEALASGKVVELRRSGRPREREHSLGAALRGDRQLRFPHEMSGEAEVSGRSTERAFDGLEQIIRFHGIEARRDPALGFPVEVPQSLAELFAPRSGGESHVADGGFPGGALDRKADPKRLPRRPRHPVAVDPAAAGELSPIEHHADVHPIQQREITQVRKEVGLHDRNPH